MNTCTARIIETDNRRPHLHGLVHDLADFLGMGLRQRAAKHREVLAVNEDQAPVDHAVPGHDTVPRNFVFFHTEVGATVFNKHVPLFKGAFVEQNL